MSGKTLEITSEQLIKLAGETYQDSGALKPEILHSLYLLHGQTLLSALDLIDNEKVTIIECPSGRWVYKVIGGSGAYYTLLPNLSFCQCPAYRYSVLKRKDSLVCKHVLAAKLSSAMKIVKREEISNDSMIDVILNV
ncbi:Zinc finger SWIM domain-containing protein 7 [Armadillidium vulgare]|nr:Zinc finger SWIM domain-containing protein 7 [Armadillidium vulgare]